MGVGPCEWSEVNKNAATKEGFIMNTLRRIPRQMAKAVAAGAVLVAAVLPVVAMSAPASAATAATLTCTVATTAASPTCASGYAIVGQGFAGNFYALGSGFANDQAVGGTVSVTTTAPGVTFTNVVETATTVRATITTTSATTPGFFPVTVTDDNGASTQTLGLGVDHGPQIATIAGNAGTAGGAPSTVSITGTFLNGASVTVTGTGTAPTVGAVTTTPAGTTLSVTLNNSAATAGSYTLTVTAPWPTGAHGAAISTYTVNAVTTPLTISGVTPNFLSIPASPLSSNYLLTLSGTGFEPGAVVSMSGEPSGVTPGASTYVNSTTLTLAVNVNYTAGTGQANLTVLNPDSTTITGTGIVGINTAAAAPAGPTPPVAPTVSYVSGAITPGTSTIVMVQGSATFPITTGSTVSVSLGYTNASEILSGTVVSVTAGNLATVRVVAPRFAWTNLTAASVANATSVSVANTSGINGGTVTFVDGSSTQAIAYSGATATSITGLTAATLLAHAVGTVVEWPFPTSGGATMSVNNGTVSQSTAASIPVTAPIPYGPVFTYAPTGAVITSLIPGTYAINAYVPGFGFSAGSSITFGNSAPGHSNGITGTIAVVNGNVATINVTVPAVQTVVTTDHLTVAGSAGQNAIVVNSTAGLTIGDSITINADPFYLVPETFTITGISGSIVSLSGALADNHSVGATISDHSVAQETSGTISAIITNGAGAAFVDASFFGLTATGTATVSLASVGAGASSAPENFTLSAATGDSLPGNWSVTSTTAGVTFVVDPTSMPGTVVSTFVSVAPGTAANASVPVKITDGLSTYTATIAVVAGPTITALTATPSLTGNTTSANIGVTGTNFTGHGVTDMVCTTSNPGATCSVVDQGTDSATTRTINITASPAALNGTFSVTLTDAATYGAGTFASAFTVTGQPTVTSVSPTVVPQGTAPTITVTGTAIPASLTVCTVTATEADGVTADPDVHVSCTATQTSATSATITGYDTGFLADDTLVFTIGNATSTVSTPAVTVVSHPTVYFTYLSSIISSVDVAQGSAAVPFRVIGSGFLPGATISIGATIGTATVTEVTPNAIFGTLNVLGTSPLGGQSVTVTNTNGQTTTKALQFYVDAAPTVSSVNGVLPASVLDGQAATLTITGSGFYPGAVVTSTNTALGTFGTATVSNGATACTANCTTLTVKFTPVSFSGSTPILDGLTITNPTGGGSVTSANSLTINPVPAVTGVYYVPTFTANSEIVITGTGFQTGITASSANPDYTVLAVSSTPTTVTLLVTTDSNATAGTSSTITLTNPDGGTGTFPLNGGPNPVVATPKPHAIRVVGAVHAGRTTVIKIIGTHFYGQPRITSNNPGTRARVSGDTGTVLTVKVTTKANVRRGVHTFTLRFANGEQTSVKYNQIK